MILKSFIIFDNCVEKIMRVILPTLITFIAVLMTLQTILRYILHMPLNSVEELILIPSIWLYFLGSIEASRKETHMNARLLEIYFKTPRQIAVIRSLSAFFGIFISIWLSYWSYDLLRYSLRIKKESLILGYRLTVIECMPFICFGLISVYMVCEFLRYAKKVVIATDTQNGGEK
jgi:TRAP-type C4-dicarboxylate transport system permease small subunit